MQDPLGYFATNLDLLELTEVKKSQSLCLLVELDSSLRLSAALYTYTYKFRLGLSGLVPMAIL